jgi:hypothetical protein
MARRRGEEPGPGEMPLRLQRFRLAEWVDRAERVPADHPQRDEWSDMEWRQVQAVKRYRAARKAWLVGQGATPLEALIAEHQEERRRREAAWAAAEQAARLDPST